MHSTGIQIGRSIILVFIFLLFAAILCEKGPEPTTNNYTAWVHNSTTSTLSFNYIGSSEYSRKEKYLIPAYDSIKVGTVNYNDVDNLLDPIEQFSFNDFLYVKIYRNDSLKVTWEGPAADLPDSVHSFFNYNSWEIKLTPDVPGQTGTINFYIEETDLE